jgi:hypothetical protein
VRKLERERATIIKIVKSKKEDRKFIVSKSTNVRKA